MRVSNATMRQNVMRNLQLSLRELERAQRQMASGRAISRPSDNPAGTAQLLGVNTMLAENTQFGANVRDGIAWLDITDETLNTLGAAFQRARELAVAGANDAMPADARELYAREVDQILRLVVDVGNASFDGGRYIFGGTHQNARPFTLTEGADGYVASVAPATATAGQGTMRYEIMRGIDMQVNTEGAALFVGGGLFASLMAVRDGLRGMGSLQAALGGVDDAFNNVLNARATVGARHNRLLMTAERYEAQHVTLSALQSRIGDVDMAEAVMTFNTRQHVYQAALAASARVLQPTLLDFMR